MLKRLLVVGLALGLVACFGSGTKPQEPKPPCGLAGVPFADDYVPPVTCSTAEKPAKHQPPGNECPIMVPDCAVPEEPEEPPEEPEVPVADGCYAPEARGDHWHPKVLVSERPSSPITGKAIMDARGAIGNPTGQSPQQTLARIAAYLRSLGFCASGPWDDAVAVEAPGGGYEEWHLVGYTDGGWTQDPFKGTWYLSGPPNPPTPQSSTCGVPRPEQEARWKVTQHGSDLDATYQVFGPEYCAAIGFTDGRRWCPVRKEGHPQRPACEAQEYGEPKWTHEGENCGPRGNPHLFRCKGGVRPLWAEVCTADGRVCKRWEP